LRIEGCEYPDSLLYDVDAGTWAKKEGSEYRIGIAPHLGWISGGFTSVSFKNIGTEVEMGKSLGSVEGPRHFDVVRAPFNWVIRGVNSQLASEPKLANKDPFGSGWFALLEQSGPVSRLLPWAEAMSSVTAIVRRLGVRCFAEFPDVEMFEIGTECSAVLVKLNEIMDKSSQDTVVHIVSDDPTSDIEMARWEHETGNTLVESRAEERLHHFIVKKK
jgi:glycine cleavage system H lipoate-binding protein/TusA-related sulfurtransferase